MESVMLCGGFCEPVDMQAAIRAGARAVRNIRMSLRMTCLQVVGYGCGNRGGRRRREAIERACRMRGGPLARRRGTATPTCAGSSPKLPARRDFNARHLLRGAWADPNSPTWCTVRKPAPAPGGLGPTPETPA